MLDYAALPEKGFFIKSVSPGKTSNSIASLESLQKLKAQHDSKKNIKNKTRPA